MKCAHCQELVTSYNLLAHAEESHDITREYMDKYKVTYNKFKVGIISEDEKDAILKKVKLKQISTDLAVPTIVEETKCNEMKIDE